MVINSVLNAPALQLDAIERAYFHGKQQGIAESEAINKMQEWDASDMAHRPNGLTIDTNIINKAKWYQEGYEAGQRDEREACAKLCEDINKTFGVGFIVVDHCAAAIRGRTE
jgi:hypothetical protein